MALYRKWRPKTFGDVKGQDATCRTLINQINDNRLGHAYLFCGSRGTGKTSVAKIFARAMNCESPIDGEPCNECSSCREILSETSMNVVEIDAASNNGVDSIREIKEQVQYPPTSGRYRIYIVDEVHMLSTAAFNALLKTLEEPPEYVKFILATTEANKIPVTVLSRCQRYDFKRITVETIVERLKELVTSENISIEDRALAYIAKCADGALRDALSLLDECVSYNPSGDISYDEVLGILGNVNIDILQQIYAALADGDTNEALVTVEKVYTEGRDLSAFASDLVWYMRDLLIISSSQEAIELIDASSENLELMKADARRMSSEKLIRCIRILSKLINDMRYSTQKRIDLELAIIKITTPSLEDSTEALVERISSLESQLEDIKKKGIAQPSPSHMDVAATHESTPAMETIEEKKIIELPKAQLDDLRMIKDDWGKIVEQLSQSYKAIYRKGFAFPIEKKGVIGISFPDEQTLELASVMNQMYQRSFTLEPRLQKGVQKDENEYVVSKEDLEKNINFPIEYN